MRFTLVKVLNTAQSYVNKIVPLQQNERILLF